MVMKDVTSPRPTLQTALANKYVAPIIVLLIGGSFAYTGAWKNLGCLSEVQISY